MSGYTYFAAEISKKDVARVQKKLGDLKGKTPTVLARAINRTANNAKSALAAKTKESYTYKTSVRSQMFIKRATAGDLSAEIKSSGKPHNLTSFSTYFSKRAGARAQVVKGVTKPVQSGDGSIKGWRQGGLGGQNGAILIRKGKSRYPIHFSHGPSTPKMLENEKVYGQVRPTIQSTLERHIDSRIKELVG